MIKLSDESILNCPKCAKEYNMVQTYEQPIISVRGKAAPKEALMEIAKCTMERRYSKLGKIALRMYTRNQRRISTQEVEDKLSSLLKEDYIKKSTIRYLSEKNRP